MIYYKEQHPSIWSQPRGALKDKCHWCLLRSNTWIVWGHPSTPLAESDHCCGLCDKCELKTRTTDPSWRDGFQFMQIIRKLSISGRSV